jgi:hypothetical protein
MPKKNMATLSDNSGPVTREDAAAEETAAYLVLSSNTISGIDDALSLLHSRKNSMETPADESRMIEFEIADQIAKKARVMALRTAFVANQRPMKPPTIDMSKTAENLLKVLDQMTAANVTASQVVVTSTQLFKIWQRTEA